MIKGQMQREFELPPRASSLIESLRDVGYSLKTALADVIDNSITARAKTVRLYACPHDESPAIGILDDGIGMSEEELFEAMRPGTKSPLEMRSDDDLGRFGLGLKTASFSQCRRLTVITRKDSTFSCAAWDFDRVAESDKWIVEIPDSLDTVPWSENLKGDGTLVVWEKLDRLATPSDKDRSDFIRKLDEAKSHIEFVFHRFLERKSLKVSLNNREMEPFDPFHSDHPATQHHPKEKIPLNGAIIKVSPVTLPHHKKVSVDEWNKYAGPEGYVRNQGFYLYRNRRLIIHGTWFRLIRQQELTKLARVRIDIPNTLDAEWQIDVRKASAQPPAPVRERLRKIIDRIVVPSRRTYTARGAKLVENNLLPVWRRTQKHNGISYEIDKKHPVLDAFQRDLEPGKILEFKRNLHLIASTIPFEALYTDVLNSPEALGPLYLEFEDLKSIVRSVWCALREDKLDQIEIEKWMRSAEPFRTQWADTAKVLESMKNSGLND